MSVETALRFALADPALVISLPKRIPTETELVKLPSTCSVVSPGIALTSKISVDVVRHHHIELN